MRKGAEHEKARREEKRERAERRRSQSRFQEEHPAFAALAAGDDEWFGRMLERFAANLDECHEPSQHEEEEDASKAAQDEQRMVGALRRRRAAGCIDLLDTELPIPPPETVAMAYDALKYGAAIASGGGSEADLNLVMKMRAEQGLGPPPLILFEKEKYKGALQQLGVM